MAVFKTIESKRLIMGKLSHGADLLEELTAVCEKENVVLGTVEAIGAVQKGSIGYYNQDEKKYQFVEFDKHLEIAGLIGNISTRDGKPMVHAHVTFSDDKGACYAGHLSAGTIIFACEFVITVCQGPDFVRDVDEQTGLPLWKL
jgi:hypothetical protein